MLRCREQWWDGGAVDRWCGSQAKHRVIPGLLITFSSALAACNPFVHAVQGPPERGGVGGLDVSELQSLLKDLALRLDRMGLRTEEAVLKALTAVEAANVQAGRDVNDQDDSIDFEEVKIEEECIRLLALYQPCAKDLRSICAMIKANSDLERIADLAAGIGRRVRYVADQDLQLTRIEEYRRLRAAMLSQLRRTVSMLSTMDVRSAEGVIELDEDVDDGYMDFVSFVMEACSGGGGKLETAVTMMNIAKAMERIGDLCTNIAEDIIFLGTGDIVRHGGLGGHHHTL